MTARSAAALTLFFLLSTTASRAGAQCAEWTPGPLDNGTLPNGANDDVFAVTTWDPDGAGSQQERLVVGGAFTSIGGVAANHIAQYDPATGQWMPFGSGIAPNVLCLAVYNGQVVAGCDGDNNEGTFDTTVKVWDGFAWQNLSATNTGDVRAMEVYNGSLYIGGSFMTHFVSGGQGPAFYLARWNPSTNLWDNVQHGGFGTQTNTAVRALAVYNNELYVGGWTKSDASITGSAAHITHGNGGGSWTAITDGTTAGGIYTFTTFAGELVVGGGFLTLNGVTYNNVAGWNGSSFHGFSSGTGAVSPQSPAVYSVGVWNGLVIGGAFTSASGNSANHVAFWPAGGFAWQALGGGTNANVLDVTYYRGKLVAVGSFTTADRPANYIAYWDGGAWNSFGGGFGSYVLAMTNYAGRIVAGGDFHQSTSSLETAHNIAGWSGGGIQPFGLGMNGLVQALESFKYPGFNGSYELIAGGSFTTAGGVATNYIARWNESPVIVFPPPAWAPMGAGFNSYVWAIERWNGATYAGGAFTASGGTSLNRIARWNETSDVWEPLGTGLNGFVYAIKEYNGALYVGGNFSTAGGVLTGGLARWNGSSWSAVGGSYLDGVLALEVYDGKLVIGGQFSWFPGNPNLIAYDGVSFSAFGSGGANSTVRALKANGTRLYAGGFFSGVGGVPTNRIAYWDGSWHDLQYGTNDFVYALGTYQNEVHVGGQFSQVDYNGVSGLPSPFWGRYTETGLPWFTQHPSSKIAQLGDDVAFTAQVAAGFTGLSFQWLHNDAPLVDGPTGNGSTIAGANSPMLAIQDAVWTDHGGYRLEVTNSCGTVTSFTATLEFTGVTAAPDAAVSATTIFEALGPNPAGSTTTLAFSLARGATVAFRVHDVRGRLVRRVELGQLAAGRHLASWDARDNGGDRVAAGSYLVRLEVDDRPIGVKRLTVLH